tara:strand:+ start:474 stop:1055 length:582 start_codon:yes stop_codon:yes gene_type:complete
MASIATASLGSKENPHVLIYHRGTISSHPINERPDGDYYLWKGNIQQWDKKRQRLLETNEQILKKRVRDNNRNKQRREENIEGRLLNIFKAAKGNTSLRAKRSTGRHYEFDIDLKYLLELWKKCNGICFRFKVEMSILDGDVWLVSLDRIDPKKGYIKGNVQLVSWTYNLMKGDKTEEDMDEVFAQFKIAVNN